MSGVRRPIRLRARPALPDWAAPVATGVLALAVCVVLATIDDDTRALLAPRCPFRTVTGLDCPGCGGTRALHALLGGDLALALDHNVVTVLLLPLLGWAWVRWLLARLGRAAAPLSLPPRVSMTLAVVLASFMVLRNLPWLPFAHLASTPLASTPLASTPLA